MAMPDKEQIYKVRFHFDALRDTLSEVKAMRADLAAALRRYEETGDHKHHGQRALKPGEACEGGDCIVAKTRALLAAIEDA